MRAVPGRQQVAWKDHLYGRCSPGQSARRWEIDCSQSVGRVGGKEWRRVGRVKNVRARLRESQIELAWKELLCAHLETISLHPPKREGASLDALSKPPSP